MAVSPKVSASTVGAAASTVVTSILAAHTIGGHLAPDVLGLLQAAVTAAVTFGAGYLARHESAVAPVVAKDAAKLAEDVAQSFTAKVEAPAPVAGA